MICCCWSSQWFGEDVGVKASDWFRTQSHLIYFDIHDWKTWDPVFLRSVFNRTRNIEYFPKTIAPFPATPMYVFARGRDLTWRATMVGGVKENPPFKCLRFFYFLLLLWKCCRVVIRPTNYSIQERWGRGQEGAGPVSPLPPCRSSFCRRRRCDNGDLHWPDIPMHTY